MELYHFHLLFSFHVILAILEGIRNNYDAAYPDILLWVFPVFHYPLYRYPVFAKLSPSPSLIGLS